MDISEDKILVSKKRLNEIIDFISNQPNCLTCPLFPKCEEEFYRNISCKEFFIDYLIGDHK